MGLADGSIGRLVSRLADESTEAALDLVEALLESHPPARVARAVARVLTAALAGRPAWTGTVVRAAAASAPVDELVLVLRGAGSSPLVVRALDRALPAADRPAAELDALTTALAGDPRTGWAAPTALAVATARDGWTDDRRAVLARLRASADPDVAAAARQLRPPVR